MQETTDGSGGLFLDICWIVPVFLDRFLDTIQIRKTKGEGTMKDWGIHLFAWRMTREERMLDGELRPLRQISDNYEKIVLSMDRSYIHSYDGIKSLYLIDWLLERA